MTKKINRTNNQTVHFMVNEEQMQELETRFKQSPYRTKREFYLDSILKNRIINIDLSGEFANELRQLQTLMSRNASNLNQIAKHANQTGIIEGLIVEEMQKALQEEVQMLFEFRDLVSNNILGDIIG